MPAADIVLENMTAAAAAPASAPDGTKQCPHGRIRAGVFFDGTGNNLYRDWGNGAVPQSQLMRAEDLKKAGNAQDPNETGEANQSKNHDPVAENGPTNVAKLYKVFIEQGAVQKKLYHHGVGTDGFAKNPTGDGAAAPVGDTRGALMGAGGKARVEWARNQLATFFSQGSNSLAIEKLIDTYGFSRGAAIARDFINEVETQGIDDLTRKSAQKFEYFPGADGEVVAIPVDAYERQVCVFHEFLGAFDTVGSFGLAGLQVGNDLAGYNFYIDHTKVRRTVHMIAEDERRHLFPVSSLFDDPHRWFFKQDRYKFKAVMQELFYPGAHSDVGGSYLWRPGEPGKAEEKRRVSIRGAVYTTTIPAVPPGPPKLPELAHIPLHDMHTASTKAAVPLAPLPEDDLHKIPGELAKMYADYCAFRSGKPYDNGQLYLHMLLDVDFVLRNDERTRSPAYTPLRDAYIHNSNMLIDRDAGQRTVLFMSRQPE